MSTSPSHLNKISQLIHLCHKVFTPCSRISIPSSCSEITSDKFKDLIGQLNKVRGEDLGVSHYASITNPRSNITYIHVFENSEFSVGIFVLGRGKKIPLHNHPRMRGFLKCVHGRLALQSYSIKPENISDSYIPAVKNEKVQLTTDDEVVSLSPTEGNIHEIESKGETPAAFLDILAPPYNPQGCHGDDPNQEIRDCDYYQEAIHPENRPGVWLKLIEQPDYACDQEIYAGIPINNSSYN